MEKRANEAACTYSYMVTGRTLAAGHGWGWFQLLLLRRRWVWLFPGEKWVGLVAGRHDNVMTNDIMRCRMVLT